MDVCQPNKIIDWEEIFDLKIICIIISDLRHNNIDNCNLCQVIPVST